MSQDGERHARVRAVAQRLGVDPRYLRRLRWWSKMQRVRRAGAPVSAHVRYVLLDPEVDNFTYEVANEDDLAGWVDAVTGCGIERATELLREPSADHRLHGRLDAATRQHRMWAHRAPAFGKRRGWYAVVRATGPRSVIETGVHDGLGSLLLLRALERNADEGRPGRLIGIDTNRDAGWMVGSHPLWQLHVGPSRVHLPDILPALGEVDVFIHDSLHSRDNETFELGLAARHRSPRGILITDNAHVNDVLTDLCARHRLAYAAFAERPVGHFYPGGVMAAAYPSHAEPVLRARPTEEGIASAGRPVHSRPTDRCEPDHRR